ncbi:hypothetical protein DPMN_040008 [Dreissena polymorpha]|uniref:Uncharacterized protein n=1 Tax=Dreissena polymorpha TaxID=45954 RepID=A0A9D4CUF4_DREPO|nr:hypothetical protein DPMN_040008 [Dreissena polymorpha]
MTYYSRLCQVDAWKTHVLDEGQSAEQVQCGQTTRENRFGEIARYGAAFLTTEVSRFSGDIVTFPYNSKVKNVGTESYRNDWLNL